MTAIIFSPYQSFINENLQKNFKIDQGMLIESFLEKTQMCQALQLLDLQEIPQLERDQKKFRRSIKKSLDQSLTRLVTFIALSLLGLTFSLSKFSRENCPLFSTISALAIIILIFHKPFQPSHILKSKMNKMNYEKLIRLNAKIGIIEHHLTKGGLNPLKKIQFDLAKEHLIKHYNLIDQELDFEIEM